eukprot:9108415-Alexandrium_andersonii.AAC.1
MSACSGSPEPSIGTSCGHVRSDFEADDSNGTRKLDNPRGHHCWQRRCSQYRARPEFALLR